MTNTRRSSAHLPTYRKAILQVVAYRRLQATVGEVLAKFHLSTTQWIVLGLIHDSAGGLRVTDIAKALRVELPLITTITRSLTARHLMTSSRHARDKRAKVFTLTDDGRQKVAEVEQRLQDRFEKFEYGADEQEVSTYFRLLEYFGSPGGQLSAGSSV